MADPRAVSRFKRDLAMQVAPDTIKHQVEVLEQMLSVDLATAPQEEIGDQMRRPNQSALFILEEVADLLPKEIREQVKHFLMLRQQVQERISEYLLKPRAGVQEAVDAAKRD
jgi:hypothetical protein